MSAEFFLDTNVLVYMFDETDDHKRTRSEHLVHQALANGTGCISFQVVQETLNVLTTKLDVSTDEARRMLENVLMPLWRVYPSRAIYHRGLELYARYGFGYYDSLIVAAAIDAGCACLYTEDLQHGRQIENLTITDPYAT